MGKSNILSQYTNRKFKGEHDITIGCEFMAKNVTVENQIIRIQVWDTVRLNIFKLRQAKKHFDQLLGVITKIRLVLF